MERAPQWILSLSLWLAFIQLFLNLGNTMLVGRKLTNNDANPDFISIDCGASDEYTDTDTGFWYQTDANFAESGENSMVAPALRDKLDYRYFGGLLQTLRIFPEGKRNCYTLRPKQGKHTTYLIRAYFAYGNYDGKNQTPIFDLYLGVNHWETVNLENNYYLIPEIIHTPTTDKIHVCLVKTVTGGIPFISALELRPLSSSIYQTPTPSQSLLINDGRFDVASTSLAWHSRYKDDIYDRLWRKTDVPLWYPINGSEDIDPGSTNDSYKLPAQVLRSAAQPFNSSYALNYDYDSAWINLEKSSKYYVYFHFAEIKQLSPGQKRVIDITVNDKKILSEPIILEYLKPLTVTAENAVQGNVRFSISATSKSDAPPILNAFEIYKSKPLSSPTDERDVDAILDVKNTYKISKLDWQGDPCVPNENRWEGLGCSSGINDSKARITSVNLSTSKLAGHISTSFSQLTELESLDLSGNDLSGSLPEFLADLPKLKILNLSGNKLTGSIPKAFKDKPDLQLSLADNPGLCLMDSCEKHKFVIPLVASISASIVVILLVSLGIWISKTKKLKVVSTNSTKEQSLELQNRAFSYPQVLSITNNLQDLIGEGGFGKVYFGTLKNDTQVAVKLLSQSSMQGDKEFRSEARLLMVVHHRNLVSLIGYCEDGVRALIYEYMANGDLRQHLSGEKQNVLKWNERVQIALDAAYGLEYLHNGCKPPIVHRDLKTANILLNQNMEAKIADFGLSRAFANDIDTHVSVTFLAGTPGYVDPEFQTSRNLTKRSDVYSFGIILLELITGKPPIRREPDGSPIPIRQWITPKLETGDIQSIVDPRLQGKYSANSAWKFLEIAMSCTSPSAIQRPDISHVVAELKECVDLEITVERTRRSTNSSNSLNTSSFQFDSEFMPFAR